MIKTEDGITASNIKEKWQIIEDNTLIKEYKDMLKEDKKVFLQNVIDLHTERDELLEKTNNGVALFFIGLIGFIFGIIFGFGLWGVI